jgi:hypothetical protein
MLGLNPHPLKAEGAAPGGTSAAKAANVARDYGTTEVVPSRSLFAGNAQENAEGQEPKRWSL